MKLMSMDDRLSKTRFDSDDHNPHIIVDKEGCRTCDHRACTTSCPAERYKWDTVNDLLSFDHVGCFECGNCRLVCERLHNEVEGYSWNYPEAGMGVVFREG
ncbi:4Fe-4S ferredoxin [Bacillus sp. B15-48]|uniref:ferredoxin family protein n=1 Tax=Bacillus sp. B15-48 TaxID=1548601 RepID=UPI00193F94B6|nr:4Fe-4S ferredoxin [Bacillus sp. B15-48]MBM4761278.1 4Fe-4S ferredoxin [Bacillus sp. B15-48]